MTPLMLAIALLGAPSFEEAHALLAMQRMGLQPDVAPEGKRVAFVRIVRYEVLVEHEPFPTVFNVFHWLTTEKTVARELLFAAGDTYDPEAVAESARNLREMTVFALARIQPVLARKPDEVGILVVTRDLWSLRLESEFQTTDSHLDRLELRMTERNLFGRANRASVRYGVAPTTWSPGLRYFDRRVAAKPVSLLLAGDLVFRRSDDKYDGLLLNASLAKPFFDLKQREGWTVPIAFQRFVVRRNQAGEIVENDDGVPLVWDHRVIAADALWRRQYGGAYVLRMSGGFGVSRVDRDPNEETDLGRFDRDVQDRFREQDLPPSRTDQGPVFGAAVFRSRFRTFRDLASFGVSEDVRLGPSLGASVRVPMFLFGSTRDGMVAAASATIAEDWGGNGLVELAVAAELRVEDAVATDQRFLGRLRGATPTIALGRLVTRLEWLRQKADTRSNLVTLGGDNGLRGYPTQAFFARDADRIRGNIEWRTEPVALSYLHLGLATFYDFGSIYTDPDTMRWRQSVGFGVRMLLPQFNRFVLRFDIAWALDPGFGGPGVGLESGQAVPLTVREDALFEHTIGGLFNQP